MSVLCHYGVKGQQWGVLNGPPYPIQEGNPVRIRKGTEVRRLSMYDESVAKGHAYVTYLNGDIEHYKGFFAARLKALNGPKVPVYSIKMTAANDLMSPGKNERVKTFVDLYKNDPAIGKELGAYYKSDWHNFSPLPSRYYQYKFSRLDDNKLTDKGYDTFVRSIGGNEYIRSRYFDELSKKGYSYVIDDMDAGRFGKNPAIVFDRNKSLNYEGQEMLSNKDIYDTYKREGTYIKRK